jgi:YihY family inner membrane protein
MLTDLAPRPGLPVRVFRALAPTVRYWMQTEVHVFAFSISANVLLSFFPFLIVSISLSRAFFDQQTTVSTIDFALRSYFPDALGQFLHNNLPQGRKLEFVSIFLLLFTANGIFEPLEVALNHVWGIHKNRSFLFNQVVSLALIFACGSLALLSLVLTALNHSSLAGNAVEAWVAALMLKVLAMPLSAVILFLVYRFLPNGKPPLKRVIPAAIGVGLLLEVMKYVNTLVWPRVQAKLASEYGVFRYSVMLIFLSFVSSLLVLAGAEWSARGHRFDQTAEEGSK